MAAQSAPSQPVSHLRAKLGVAQARAASMAPRSRARPAGPTRAAPAAGLPWHPRRVGGPGRRGSGHCHPHAGRGDRVRGGLHPRAANAGDASSDAPAAAPRPTGTRRACPAPTAPNTRQVRPSAGSRRRRAGGVRHALTEAARHTRRDRAQEPAPPTAPRPADRGCTDSRASARRHSAHDRTARRSLPPRRPRARDGGAPHAG